MPLTLLRDRHGEDGAAAELARDGDLGAEGFGKMLHDREAEAGTADLPRAPGVDAIETLEETREVARFDSGAGVLDDEAEIVGIGLDAQGHACAARAVLDRVVDEVAEDLLECALIAR